MTQLLTPHPLIPTSAPSSPKKQIPAIISRKQTLSILLFSILCLASNPSPLYSQDATEIELSSNKYLRGVTGEAESRQVFRINFPKGTQLITVQLEAVEGDADLIYPDEFGYRVTNSRRGPSESFSMMFPSASPSGLITDTSFEFFVVGHTAYKANIEILMGDMGEYSPSGVRYDNPDNGIELSPSATCWLSLRSNSSRERFIQHKVTIPPGVEKYVITWQTYVGVFDGNPNWDAQESDLMINRTGWVDPTNPTWDQISAGPGRSQESIILNYPNPGPLYITIGKSTPSADVGRFYFDGVLDLSVRTVPYSSPLVETPTNSTFNYIVTPMYFFQRSDNLSYFFTANLSEKDNVVTSLPVYNYRGVSHHVISNHTRNSKPVYRFINRLNGSHFYTADKNEANRLIYYNERTYQYEGISFYVFLNQETNTLPVYRFFQPSTGSHFFTINRSERDNLIAHSSLLNYEGVAWYAYP